MNGYDLIVIGGGAAGFYGAIQAAEANPSLHIIILEKSTKLLSKVRVSGGGRCNVTHHCYDPIKLSHHYPRGEKALKELLKRYQAKHVVDWFVSKGVDLKAEEDGRMFPISNSSETIISCFLRAAKSLNIQIETKASVQHIRQQKENLILHCEDGRKFTTNKVLITTGGHANPSAYNLIKSLGHNIILPIPSLFTFNDSEKKFIDLMGLSVPGAQVRIAGTKFSQPGPVLLTHWGLSGPCIIKLSAWAAEYLHQVNYQFTVLVNWLGGDMGEEALRKELNEQKRIHPKQRIILHPLRNLPQRLWKRICELSEVDEKRTWSEIPQRSINKLVEFLIRCPFHIKGKTTFKEEFVTCGGVDLKEVNLETMESRKCKNIFFAGEVLNIDGETGGFNFQAAWTTAYVAAHAIAYT